MQRLGQERHSFFVVISIRHIMQIDWTGAERFLSYVSGDVPLSSVWNHPAYEVVKEHAALLGRDLTREDLRRAVEGEQTTFSVDDPTTDQKRTRRLIAHVRSNEDQWCDRIERHLERIAPHANTSDVVLYLGIGYSLGIGVSGGAYINLNEPLFQRMPRQLLYTAIHETSHVLYEWEHDLRDKLGPTPLTSRNQQDVWNTVFHTEAYATYAPLELRRSDENIGSCDHPMCEDYRLLQDDSQMRTLVQEYDSFRGTLRRESVSQESLFSHLFGGSRLPYRVGCAMIEGIERSEGLDGVRAAFQTDPDDFSERYDWTLDKYRTVD